MENSSVDIIISVMAAHWFDLDKFYAECQRVLKPGGVLALSGYKDTCPKFPGNGEEKKESEFNNSMYKLIKEVFINVTKLK